MQLYRAEEAPEDDTMQLEEVLKRMGLEDRVRLDRVRNIGIAVSPSLWPQGGSLTGY